MNDPLKRWFRLFPAMVLAMLPAGCRRPTQQTQSIVPQVTASRPLSRTVTDYEDFTGRTDAVSTVDIRARVTGYLVKVHFKDGDIVEKDALLYEIDPRPFQADLDRANGEVERLEAEQKLLVIQVDRYRKLATTGAGSQQDLDEYLAKQAENVGALKAAKAQVAQATLNLGFTRIAAPLTGKISRTLLTAGNLVNADNTLLTTIMSIDPMYAYFDIEEPTLLKVRTLIRKGVIQSKDTHDVEVRMGLADDPERKFPLRGTLDFVNNTVDPQTGTIAVRGVFPNPYELRGLPPVLTPGLFARVRLPLGPPHQVLLITERAIGTDQGQKFVYVLDEANKAVYRGVATGQMFDGLLAIEEGLKPQDRIVVNGLQRIRSGIQVQADLVDMAILASTAPAQNRPAAIQPLKPEAAPPKPATKVTPGKASAAKSAT
jgi:RND family efflux transporter MFP subunit